MTARPYHGPCHPAILAQETTMPGPTTDELVARIEILERQAATRSRRVPLRRSRLALLTLGLVAVLAIPIGAFASHQFTDVGTGSGSFHTQISRVKGAGITAGCSPTTYCPNDPVTRGQMAAFLARTGGRGADSSYGKVLSIYEEVLGTITIKAGDVAGGVARVLLMGSATTYTSTLTGCPCGAGFWFRDLSDDIVGSDVYTAMTAFNYSTLYVIDSATAVAYVDVPTGVEVTFTFNGAKAGGTASVYAYGTLTATYVPFDGLGGNPTLTTTTGGSDGRSPVVPPTAP
jgi:hypothetical protein